MDLKLRAFSHWLHPARCSSQEYSAFGPAWCIGCTLGVFGRGRGSGGRENRSRTAVAKTHAASGLPRRGWEFGLSKKNENPIKSRGLISRLIKHHFPYSTCQKSGQLPHFRTSSTCEAAALMFSKHAVQSFFVEIPDV